MTSKEIIKKLINEKGYDSRQTERLEDKLDAMSPEIKASLENWLETGNLESPEYSGYTVRKILEKQPYKEIGAFIMLDWLKHDPDNALKALQKPYFKSV